MLERKKIGKVGKVKPEYSGRFVVVNCSQELPHLFTPWRRRPAEIHGSTESIREGLGSRQEDNQVVDSVRVSDLRHYIGGRDLFPVGGDKSPGYNESKHGHDASSNNIQRGSKHKSLI